MVTWSWLAVISILGMYIFTVFYRVTSDSLQWLLPTITASLLPRLDMMDIHAGMALGLMFMSRN